MGEGLAVARPNRPIAVWLIFLWYMFAACWTLLGFVVIYKGLVPLTEAQQAYIAHLNFFDYVITAIVTALNIAAPILLFRLSRTAVPLFAAAFVLNLGTVIRAVFGSNWTEAIGHHGMGGYLGLFIAFAISLYAIRLRRRGILN